MTPQTKELEDRQAQREAEELRERQQRRSDAMRERWIKMLRVGSDE